MIGAVIGRPPGRGLFIGVRPFDLTKLHRPAGLGRLAGIALAEHQDVLVGPAELAGGGELAADPDRQRAHGGDEDRVVVEPGASGLEGFHRQARQVDEEAVGIADIANHPDGEAVWPEAGDGLRDDLGR
ncbi:MAG: hypothetical protein A3D16_19675 [Rhodobacterales bacterium RIFCSPHIGHO2_02_FULL_62_130]|nr:MAG: hypothetical protein A3D16_19675 [Rhodobacterales bacterium RIFCSPHIGHO2_02_FULL_62_130]OHC57009.1 MAG: hypothetical protein A3E48_11930 [Rhodobacterales bacterium RIFCSPHIGHO2_12_FULL_62_75]